MLTTKRQKPADVRPCTCDRFAFPHRRAWQCDELLTVAGDPDDLGHNARELAYIRGQDARAINRGDL